ncbi:hypothetical protein [Alkalihalobacillus sp. AL-G]|uniref:hypothetical protein n=1 Tax=Alkalihalobacillus sp. AL-G TaxID=2926399 RepID=UPI00272C25F5|nr:hypothetical protein [Alkalihalobacillus sp. AL-G]WLD94480.1 hypothetical protein MOJ78_06215 [Alkalihalobacillus sp. AL-G]
MDSTIKLINGNSWADCSLVKLAIEYDKIEVIVTSDENNNEVKIICKDYIGFSYVGHWDESVIKDINVETKGSLIEASIQTIKQHYGEKPLPGGGTKNIIDKWYQLNIELIDGNKIKIACKEIEN